MSTRSFPPVKVEGDAVDIGAQLASRLVLPVAQQLLKDGNVDTVTHFYASLIVALHLQVAVVLGKDTETFIADAAKKEVTELDVDAFAAAGHGGVH